MSLHWSLFRHAQDNKPKAQEGTWDDLAPLFERTYKSSRPTGTDDERKKGMPAFCGATFREGSVRGVDGVKMIHVLCFDFDSSATEPTGEFYDERRTRPKLRKVKSEKVADPEEVISRLKKYSFRAYTTWSHTPGWPKFRVVLPLEMPVSPGQYVALGEWAIQELSLGEYREGGCIDLPVLRDPSRMNFLPTEGATFWKGDGELLSPGEKITSVQVPDLPEPTWARGHSRPSPENNPRWSDFGISIVELDAVKLLQTMGCSLSPERVYKGGTKRRLTCPFGHEHSHGADGDDAVLILEQGKWPSFSCAHSGHTTIGILEILQAAKDAGLDLTEFAPALRTEFDLDDTSSDADIAEAIKALRYFSPIAKERAMEKIAKQTKLPKKLLSRYLKPETNEPEDEADALLQHTLSEYYANGESLLMTPTKLWMAYNGIYWGKISNPAVVRGNMVAVARERGCSGAMSAIVGQAMTLAEGTLSRSEDVFRFGAKDVDVPRVVNCRNGELWIDDDGGWDFRAHRPGSFLTYALGVDFKEDAQCPLFDQALHDTFAGDEDMVRHIWEFFGYVIQPRRTYRTWWLWFGRGANGKTSLAKTLQQLIAQDSILPIRMDSFGSSQFDTGSLRGKLLALDDDMATNTELPEGLLKQLSEDKMLSGRDLFESNAQFVSRVVPLMLTNNIPHLRDLTDGTKRRAKIIQFPVQFADRSKNPYPDIWKHEMSGILWKSIQGFRRLRERGGFEDPQASTEAFTMFLEKANPTARFVLSICRQDPGYTAPLTEVYAAYKAWAEFEGLRNKTTRGWFRDALEDQGVKVTQGTGDNYGTEVVHGLRPKEQSADGVSF